MWDTLMFLLPPFIMSLLAMGVLSYFGNHILSRGIIFIDIAVAQIAALGTMIAILIGMTEQSIYTMLFSLVFTLIVISVFSFSRFEKQEIPQEAIIGIIYGLSLAVGILIAEKVPGGANFIEKTISGNILWVTWTDILECFILFLSIGIIHIFFGKKFIKISDGNTENFSISKIRILDLIFYISFGVIMVKTVDICGVFVIFTYLIAPASTAIIYSTNWNFRIILSWIVGFIGSVLAIIFSYNFNLPNGPTIVCVLGLILILAGTIKKIFVRKQPQENQYA